MTSHSSGTNNISNVLGELATQIEQLLLLLSQKERFVVEKRFSINSDKRSTLEEIGQHFSITRERVRQIEKNALQKLRRIIENFKVYEINNHAFEILNQNGGVLREDLLISKLLSSNSDYSIGSLQLILTLDKRFDRLSNTIQYHPYYMLSHWSLQGLERACEESISYLRKKGDVDAVSSLAKLLKSRMPEIQALEDSTFFSLFQINKQFKLIDKQVGLMEWRHIHPRTLRDKIFFILRSKNDAMHFVEVGNAIVSTGFDRKSINMQAVHNELIRHPDFVLVGRGLYALKEWGYEHGTVADVIAAILKGKESLSEEEILAEVSKKRQVKPITVILNLKNKPQFTRVGRKQYALKK
jgi:hypothetical protein